MFQGLHGTTILNQGPEYRRAPLRDVASTGPIGGPARREAWPPATLAPASQPHRVYGRRTLDCAIPLLIPGNSRSQRLSLFVNQSGRYAHGVESSGSRSPPVLGTSSGESLWMHALQLREAMNRLGPANSQVANAMSQSHAKRTSSLKCVFVVWPRQAISGGEQPVDLRARTDSR